MSTRSSPVRLRLALLRQHRRTAGLALRVSVTAALLAVAVAAGAARPVDLPEALRTVEVRSRGGVVVANTHEAAEAGASLLRAGGNAIDAAVAAAFALNVSEPMLSGLGGHAWMVVHLADGRDLTIDGSGEIPQGVDPPALERLRRAGLLFGHKVATAPGDLAALALASGQFGTRRLPELLAPAIALADSGCRLTAHQRSILANHAWKLPGMPPLDSILLSPAQRPWEAGHVHCWDDLARTLRRLAAAGPEDLYRGRIADAIDADMTANGGFLRKSDLARVHALVRPALRGRYRGLDVLSLPGTGGGAAVIEALQILDHVAPESLDQDGADRLMLLLEAVRIAQVDALAAAGTGGVGELHVLDPRHAAARRAQIRPEHALTTEEILGRSWRPPRMGGTTEISVVDTWGNAVALTQSLNADLGAAVATPGLGFIFNATLSVCDFDDPASRSYPSPGRSLPSTVAPTILLRNGKPFLVLGSPGSARITSAIVGTIVNIVDRGMSPGAAVAAPRVLWDGDREPRLLMEMAAPNGDTEVAELHRRGFPVIFTLRFPEQDSDVPACGAVNTVMVDEATGEAVGVGDPRRAGAAAAGGLR